MSEQSDAGTVKTLAIGVFGAIGLLAVKQFYIVGHLGYPAGPSQVDSSKEMAQYCSYSTACPTPVWPTVGILLAATVVLGVVKFWRQRNE